MKRIGILTWFFGINYGARAHSLALMKTVESFGYECEFINFTSCNNWKVEIRTCCMAGNLKRHPVLLMKGIRKWGHFNRQLSAYPRSKKVTTAKEIEALGYDAKGTYFFSPRTTYVDPVKLFLITIGDYCKITDDVKILAHDYSRSVVRYAYGENIGGGRPTTIGNNVFIGMNTTILMGTTIGNNVIIGANSVVNGTFPDNVVIGGNPARIICSIEAYTEKRKKKCLDDAVACAKRTYENTGKYPTIKQMGDGFAWLYLPRTEETIRKYPDFFDLRGDNYEAVRRDFLASEPMFDSYEAFLSYVQSN